MEWIKVSERVPENYGSYLVWDSNNPFDKNQCVARYDHHNETFFIAGSDVIHPQFWMPLPEPPKPE